MSSFFVDRRLEGVEMLTRGGGGVVAPESGVTEGDGEAG